MTNQHQITHILGHVTALLSWHSLTTTNGYGITYQIHYIVYNQWNPKTLWDVSARTLEHQ